MTIWGLVHLIFILSALVTFSISILFGLIFLVQEYQLKQHRPIPVFFGKFPALEVMDRLHYKALTIGFLLLSLGMMAGSILSKQLFGVFFNFDPRQTASLVTWGIYALFLNVRIHSGWRGRRGILLSLLGFTTVILTFLAVHHRVP